MASMAVESFPDSVLVAISKAIGEAFTGSELTSLLRRAGVDDQGEAQTKWRRIHDDLVSRQATDRSGNNVANFIQIATEPANFVGRRPAHEALCKDLNQGLAFVGLQVGEDGKLRRVAAAHTLTEAEQRADRLRAELTRRRIHPDVLRFCRAELLVDDYFHAVFEAAKSVADKLRRMTGLRLDGVQLVDAAFDLGQAGPFLVVNRLRDQTERNEHQGTADLMRGMFKLFRNVPAHVARIEGHVLEEDAMDLLVMASYLHRRLDAASPTHRANQAH
jgi:uncharacterized protein (TIGR02391 family)